MIMSEYSLATLNIHRISSVLVRYILFQALYGRWYHFPIDWPTYESRGDTEWYILSITLGSGKIDVCNHTNIIYTIIL